jgi:hypothetical protein
VSFLNMFGIGGAGLLQFLSGRIFDSGRGAGEHPAAYSVLFLVFLLPLAVGLVIYLFSRDDPAS